MGEPAGSRLSRENPWPGLVSFREEDRAYFHGRDAETAELMRLVRREPLAVLFGRSGLGKTSLLNAGLFPVLRQENFVPVHIRLGCDSDLPLTRQVLDALLRACEAAGVEAPAPPPEAGLWAYFHRTGAAFWNARNRPVVPVLVFDQFEEVFTVGQEAAGSRERSAAFLAELGDLVENRMPEAVRREIEADPDAADRYEPDRRGVKVVLSFREDFLAEMEGLKRQIPSLMRNRYRLRPMDGAQAYEVVTASGGHLMSGDVARRIVGLAWRNVAEPPPDPADYPGMEVDPALLSVICSELNARRRRAGREAITADLLEGADREILSDFYERSFEGLDPAVRAFVEDELITDRGYRDSFVLEDAVKLPGLSGEAIDRLVARRLLRIDERLGLRRIELTHDVLTRVVKDSRDSRKAREAEAAALAREKAAAEQQRRNARNATMVAAGAVFAAVLLGLAAWSWKRADDSAKAEIAATEKMIAAKADADAAKAQADAALKRADDARDAAEKERISSNNAQEALKAVAQEAAGERRSADEAKRQAVALIAQAKATDLIISARTVRHDLDLALLLGAEAARVHEHRLDGQVDLLGLIVANLQLKALLHTEDAQTSYAFSPDGKALAVGTAGGQVTLWSTQNWQVTRTWSAGSDPVTAVAFGPDGSRLAAAGPKSASLWRVPQGELAARTELQRDLRPPLRLKFSPGGTSVAVEAASGSVGLWRLAGGDSKASPEVIYPPRKSQTGQKPGCIAFGRDGGILTVGRPSDALVRWDVATARLLPAGAKFDDVLGYSPDCERAAVRNRSESGANTIQVLDIQGSETSAARVIAKIEQARAREACFSPDGRAVAVAEYGKEGRIHVYDARTAEWLQTMAIEDGGRVDTLSFSPDGNVLAMALEDGTLIARDWKSEATRLRAETSGRVGEIIFSPDGRALLTLGSDTGRVNAVWSLERGEVLMEPDGTPHESDEVEFNHLGDTLASVLGDSAYFWDAGDRTLRGKHSNFHIAEFSPDGTRVAIARQDGPIEIRDASGEPLENTIPRPGDAEAESLAFSWGPRNRKLAIGFGDGSVAIYDLETRPPRALLKSTGEHRTGKTQVAFSPDGALLASSGADGRVVFWRAGDGWKPAVAVSRSKHVPLRLAFSPDGKLLASANQDKTAVLYDVDRRREVAEFVPRDGVIRKLDDSLLSVVFVEGSTALVMGGAKTGPREVWDVAGRRWLTTLKSPGGPAGSLALSPRGRRIALRHDDGQVALRDWEASALVRDACRIANRNLTCVEWRQYMGDRPYRRTCEALPGPAEACR